MKKIVIESLLIESPDTVYAPDEKYYEINTPKTKTYSFEVIVNTETNKIADVLISKKSNLYHGEDPITAGPHYGLANKTQPSYDIKGTYKFDWKKSYPGRIFLTPKIITFWVYPDMKEMREIIGIMAKKLKMDLVNKGWMIEVYSEGMKDKGSQEYDNNYDRDKESTFVPIEKFVSSKRPPEKAYLQHIDTQHKHDVPVGYGSRNPKYAEHRRWQMASMTDESLHPLSEDKTTGLKKRLIKTVKDARGDEVNICLVNGDYVTSEEPGLGFKEFTEGGHHFVTSYPGYKLHIPENEIWIDDVYTKEPEKLKGIIQHEFIERNLMKYKKWNYSEAHEYANKKEAELRKKSEK